MSIYHQDTAVHALAASAQDDAVQHETHEDEALRQQLLEQQAKLQKGLQALMTALQEHRKATNKLLQPSRSRLSDGARAPAHRKALPAQAVASGADADAFEAALHRGEARRAAWTRDGTLVPAAALAGAWGRSRQALDQACVRHELFNLKIGNRRWYPAVFLHHDAHAVAAVCQALGAGDPASMLVFWLRPHGGLGGRTVSEALGQRSGLGRVLELARAWATEHGWPHAAAA